MNRFVCIHGHFYQPPRENPWLEFVEPQDSARPYHDWNARVCAECYAPNTAARILDGDRRIIDIVNNFAGISFNVGPTLLAWLERMRPEVYRAILQADRDGAGRFGGHGPAIAQPYNHLIMPLADERDRLTQVRWGIADFERRFGRHPEGMWLPETAVDLPTLAVLAGEGIRFTILAPHQARRVRRLGAAEWQDVSGERVDPRRPYRCRLPGGAEIALFFYDGLVSRDVSFGSALSNGEGFAKRLVGAFAPEDRPQLVHVATDGETYGHHKAHGDMALAYCRYYLQSRELAQVTVYGEYLAANPPEWEVEILEDSSWSCPHGVERWRSDCGCGSHPGWRQLWRAPLREAMDWLRDACRSPWESAIGRLLSDPWAARDRSVALVLDRSEEATARFLAGEAGRELGPEERVRALELLELQRHAMLMFTSCGWFFDDISGIEAVQVLAYAARVIQLAEHALGLQLEERFGEILARAPSNVPDYGSGREVYQRLARSGRIDLLRVAAHYAVSSLLEEQPETRQLYCYTVRRLQLEREEAGNLRLSFGHVLVRSDITGAEQEALFACLHLGGHNVNGGVGAYPGPEAGVAVRREMGAAFARGDVLELVRLMDRHFGSHTWSLWSLFREEQLAFFAHELRPLVRALEHRYRRIWDDHHGLIQAAAELRVPLPEPLALALESSLEAEAAEVLERRRPDPARLRRLLAQTDRFSVRLDGQGRAGSRPSGGDLGLAASRRVAALLEALAAAPRKVDVLHRVVDAVELIRSLPLSADLWQAQNSYFLIGREHAEEAARRAAAGDESAERWVEGFRRLGELLQVRFSP
jgi:alpha-amylase/alpha-mannosidase (GH57 family)